MWAPSLEEGRPLADEESSSAKWLGGSYTFDAERSGDTSLQKTKSDAPKGVNSTSSLMGMYVVKGISDLQEGVSQHCSPGRLAIIVIVYLTVGTIIGVCTGWTVIDSLYFTVTTFTTVGYGDVNPPLKTWGNRIGAAIFGLVSVFVVGTTFGLLLDGMMDEEQSAVEAATVEAEWEEERTGSGSENEKPSREPSTRTLLLRSEEHLGRAALIYKESRKRLSSNWRWNGCMLVSVIFLGTLVGLLEGWDLAKSFYWACVTISTVGYGDVTPKTPVGRLLATGLMLYGVFVVAHCIASMLSYRSQIREVRLREKVLLQFGAEFTAEKYHTLAHGGEVHDLGLCSSEENITRSEFCLYMLIKMNRVSKEELQSCQLAFDSLDVGGDGFLDLKDVDHHDQMTQTARSSRLHRPRNSILGEDEETLAGFIFGSLSLQNNSPVASASAGRRTTV